MRHLQMGGHVLFKYYLSGPIQSFIKARAALPTETIKVQERCLTSYSALVNYFPERFAIENSITALNVDMRAIKEQDTKSAHYAQ